MNLLADFWRNTGPLRDFSRAMSWLVMNGREFRQIMIAREVSQLRPWRPDQWHRQARYFHGRYSDRSLVFIKAVDDVRKLENEYVATLKMMQSSVGDSFVASVKNIDLSKPYPAMISTFLESRSLVQFLQTGLPTQAARHLANQLVALVEALDKCSIVHRDLTPENLLVLNSGNLICIDFAYAVIDGKQDLDGHFADDLEVLGKGYRPDDGWDDAYSALCILSKIEKACGDKFPDVKTKLVNCVGRRFISRLSHVNAH